MLELTPFDFLSSGKGDGKSASYGIFMVLWAAFLFFGGEIIGGLLVLAAWILPMIFEMIFPGFYDSWIYKTIVGTAIVIAMICVLFWIYRDFIQVA